MLCDIFHYFIHETEFRSMESSIYGLTLVLKTCQVLDLGLGLFSLHRLESDNLFPITNSVGLATWNSNVGSIERLGLRALAQLSS